MSAYILDAISVLELCAEALHQTQTMQPYELGSLSAKCTIAAIALKCHSGLTEVDVPVVTDDPVEEAA